MSERSALIVLAMLMGIGMGAAATHLLGFTVTVWAYLGLTAVVIVAREVKEWRKACR